MAKTSSALRVLSIGTFFLGCIPWHIASAQQIANITPTYIDFGAIAPGSQISVPVTIRNLTSSPMTLAGGGMDATNAISSTPGTCSSPLAAGASCSTNVRYLAGSESDGVITNETSIEVFTNSQSQSVQIRAKARSAGTLIGASPRVVDFGNVFLGQTMGVTIHFTNYQDRTVSFAGGGISGQPQFSANTGTCGASLTAGASCYFNYSFTPNTLGLSSASTIIAAQTAAPSVIEGYSLSFTGTGVAAPNLVTVAPVDIDFGRIKIGNKMTVPIRYRNNGTLPVNYAGGGISPTFGGVYGAVFAPGTGCTSSAIPASSTCATNYSFQPHEAIPYAASTGMSFDRPGANSQFVPFTFTGQGVGSLTRIWPQEIDFGVAAIGTSVSIPVTIYNDGELPVTSIIGGAISAPFSSTTTCTGTLAPGAQCVYTYTYNSTASSQGFRERQTAIATSNSTGMQPVTLITIRSGGADLVFRNGFDG